ncbi:MULTISPECIES: Gfo/Idh/MocA family oxidoreductase [unclassified Pseudodesulfovibrio]|uniref:Gfo/Idh/MocA family protein n=1 Tax=unclassified Pseudodesulfovibrio TaxID=2661612 RepID=UPI000FEBBCEE|nr:MULTISPECIES: Gfo/Idh/MocA family oxidoreductase [unclassified Pseudodesulfovibrio]MCJ2163232.1 Gfo/Idh/MocA family oxidoreductase [Pseudodesulfovibrio sp. S3-i]RWU07215.1 gfo/Idh/MocA family oxidoreductase [Pseudodesulfovibrio sp. S3]
MQEKVRVLVVGLGNMGIAHAKAYHGLDGFEIVGLCSRQATSMTGLPAELAGYPRFDDYFNALEALKPDAVSINTWPDTHAEFACKAFEAGAHVFLEKPIAETVAEARKVVDAAVRADRKLVVGYILRHHPSWAKFVELAQDLGKPLVMRMNLNQQSSGSEWGVHKQLMKSLSPIVDCGVHYVDIMCLMTGARPVRVNAMGARLSDEIAKDMYNYGQLQVFFDDGSVGWYEAGWGPMMSETAFFVKDVVGPKGCVSIVAAEQAGQGHESSDIDGHTKANLLRLHHAQTDADGGFVRADELIEMEHDPGHDELCLYEQEYFLKAIRENIDLAKHMQDAVNSLRIVFAADESIRTGRPVAL